MQIKIWIRVITFFVSFFFVLCPLQIEYPYFRDAASRTTQHSIHLFSPSFVSVQPNTHSGAFQFFMPSKFMTRMTRWEKWGKKTPLPLMGDLGDFPNRRSSAPNCFRLLIITSFFVDASLLLSSMAALGFYFGILLCCNPYFMLGIHNRAKKKKTRQ